MTFIPPFSYGARNVLSATTSFKNLKSTLGTLQTQLATGKTAETYAGLGSGALASMRLNARLSTLDGYSNAIQDAQIRINLASTGLTEISKVARNLGTTLAGTQPSNEITRNLGPTTALGNLAQAVDALNADVNGRFLFSGRAADTQPVAAIGLIMDGKATQAGLKQLVSERQSADLGSPATGRLTATAGATSVTLSEQAAALPFGFHIASASGFGITGPSPSGTPPSVAIDLSTQPSDGDTFSVDLTMDDGTPAGQTATIVLRAGTAGNFAIGATPAATAANLKSALDGALGAVASTKLFASSALKAATDFFNGSNSSPPPRIGGGTSAATATTYTPGTVANTVIWYQGDEGPGSPRATAPVQVGDTLSVAIGLRANEPGLPNIMAAFGALAVSAFAIADPTSATRYDLMAGKVSTALLANAPKVDDMTVDMGNASATVNLASDRVRATKAQVQTLADAIDTVSPEKVAAELVATQTQLQASYQTTSTIAKMSLVDYLK